MFWLGLAAVIFGLLGLIAPIFTKVPASRFLDSEDMEK